MEGKSFRRYGILLGLLLILGLIFPLTAFAAYTPSLVKNADGVYEIGTPAQLESFRADLAATDSTGYTGETVVLTADIDMTDQTLAASGSTSGGVFSGTFDGRGHSIKVNHVLSTYNSLIPVNKGTIKNLDLKVDCISGVGTGSSFSPLCELNWGTIRYVSVAGTITVPATVHTSTSKMNLAIGGLVGVADSNSVTEDCIGSIDYKISGTEAEILVYQNTLATTSLYQLAYQPSGTLNRCFSSGSYEEGLKKNGTEASNVKRQVNLGIAGANCNGVNYYDSTRLVPYHISFKTGITPPKESETQYIAKTTADLKTKATYTGWDFDVTWNIDEGNTYPFLTYKAAVVLNVQPVIADKAWNATGDLTATVTGMTFANLTAEQQALVDQYQVTINAGIKSASFVRMQNMGSQAVTVEYNSPPTLTVGKAAEATTAGYVFKLESVLAGQGKVVDNGVAGPDKTEQDVQIAKAKEANTIIFEKYIGDGSAYLTPLTVNDSPVGDKEFMQDFWAMFSAARGGYVPGGDTAFYDKWFANVKTSLHTLKEGGLQATDMKVTAWTKLVLAITAAGYDARDIEDYDLIKIISDQSYLGAGLVLQRETAILALVGGGYPVTTDNPIVDFATIAQNGAAYLNDWEDSSVSMGDNAMYFQHYGFYMNDNADLKAAIENLMYNRIGGDNPILQNGDGSFTTTGYDLNAYNNAQNMIALGCFNMSVFDDHFIQNGNTVLDSQFNFIDFNNRTYKGTYEITQLTRGFTAVIRQYEGRKQIFDTSDIVGATKPVNDLLIALSSESSADEIVAAKTAYNALSDAKKATIKTENLRKLYTVDSVTALIAALPQLDALTSTDQDKLSEARTAYGVLKTEDQALVTNIETLQKLEEKMSALLVIDQITALPATVTLDNKPAVTAARKAYDGLTKEQKDLINSETTTKLTDAEARIKALEEAGQVSNDQKAANAVIAKIDDLGTITSYSQKTAVETARSAYQALTSVQKNLVTNLAKLEAAETAISKLRPEITITVDVERFTIGQGFYIEPTTLAVKEGTTARAAVEQLLGKSNVIGDEGYLRAIVGADTGTATIPEYIIKELSAGNSSAANAYGQKYSGNTLGEFDYSGQSGWMYFVNNSTPSVGMNEKILNNGDVLRLAFTYWGTGADVTGSGIDVNGTVHKMSFTPANRDALLKTLAKVNGNTAYLSDTAISAAYETAMTVVQDMTASSKAINDAATALTKAIAGYKPGNTGDDVKIAKAVTDQIAALPAVAKMTLTDKAAVTAARTVYDALTAAQKALVTNLNTLTAAEAKITELQTVADQVAAKAVIDKIAALPAVDKLVLTDKDALASARAAYDALSEAQKKLVTNLTTLTAAEAQMVKLLSGEASEADKTAAKAVNDQISGLPSGDKLTLGSKADVVAARSAYNALTDIQKTLITNLDALAAAEARIAELEAATPPAKDEATGIEMVGLPEGVGLKVEPESGDTSKTDEAQKAATEAGIKDAKVVSLFSIKPDMSADDLAKFNSDPDSFVTLTMPLGDDQQGYDNYKIYHKKTDGTVEWLTPTLSADGKSLIFKVNAFSEFGVVATKASAEIPIVDFSYRTHVQNVGWQDWKNNGAMSGTEGQSLRLEGIEIKRIDTADVDLGIRYQTHIENIGWEDSWKADGTMSGTEGRSLRLEAIRIELTGADAKNYDVYYQVHAQNTGWMAFAKNGEDAGTAGFGYRLEGIHVVVVPKGQAAPTLESGSIDTAFLVKN